MDLITFVDEVGIGEDAEAVPFNYDGSVSDKIDRRIAWRVTSSVRVLASVLHRQRFLWSGRRLSSQ